MLPAMKALPNPTCPLCGGPNGCAVAASGNIETPCWCREVRIEAAVLERIREAERNQSCLCRRCASAAA